MKLPAIILVSPRNPKNIGAVARVMANFGFTDLRIVAPHPPVWEEARVTATDAKNFLKKAKVFATLEMAILDRRTVWATSCLKARNPQGKLATLPGFATGGSDAIIFGQEKRGLRLEDLAFCDGILCIPTSPGALSMNLAQAVGVVCYELGAKSVELPKGPQRIKSKELEILITRAAAVLTGIGYRNRQTSKKHAAKLRSLLRRRGIATDEAGFLREILCRIEERF
ncbi:MAG: RNA methyltransferase [Elusimicrobia bacterium]|nr:MAG: RNA methyltransferase [Elusimicrobiota bacterium]